MPDPGSDGSVEQALAALDGAAAAAPRTLAAAASLEDVARAESELLGRRSPLAAVQRGLGGMSQDDRRRVGRRTNEVREALRTAISTRRAELEAAAERALLESERIDVTLPGRAPARGGLHPLSLVEREIIQVFLGMGYRVAEGPEVETDWYNFEALNFPPDHPARSMHDTIYVDWPGRDDVLLRTHTSPVQIRTMEAQAPPIYVITPGRTYRNEAITPKNSPVFHQVEGLAVDEGLSMANLKGTLLEFVGVLLGGDQDVRLTPCFFPFTEPSAQVGVRCFVCGGKGCRVCGQTGWIELLGAGMVDPNVFQAVGIDPERYTGFAFGLGTDRVAMLRYGIPDIRLLMDGDERFLAQFRGEL